MPELKRTLGLVECTLMGVGVMLGAGIYALVGQASLLAGNMVWASFLLASFVAGCTGLSYAELSSFIPKAGGEYYYARRGLGNLAAFLVSWLLVIGIAIAASAVALGFAGYLNAMTGVNRIQAACLLIVVSTGVLVYGIKESAWVAGICTALELIGLAAVVAVGVPELGTVDYFATASGGLSGVASAGALVFFAYIGFEEIVQLAEETHNPTRNIPRDLLLSIATTTVIYVGVAACAVSVVPWQELAASESPLADVVAVAFGQKAFIGLSIIALFSTGNTVMILIMSAARLLYGMAEDGKMPKALAAVHRSRQTPYMATVAVATISVVVTAAMKNLAVVANLTNFALLLAFVIINAALIILRYREPAIHRPFRIPLSIGRLPIVPLFGICASLFMISYIGVTTMLLGLGLGVLGLVVYFARGSAQQ